MDETTKALDDWDPYTCMECEFTGTFPRGLQEIKCDGCGRTLYLVKNTSVDTPGLGVRELLKQHEDDTRQLAELLMKQYRYAGLINMLANIILDNKSTSDNDRYEAEQAIELVRPLL